MLTPTTVAAYLLRKGLVQAATVVRGDLAVLDASRRNLNFKVVSEDGPSYLVKQGIGPDKAHTLANEAAFYRLLVASGTPGSGYKYAPRLHLYDQDEQVLVIELLHDARSLGGQSQATGRFSAGIAEELGRALATLHKLYALTGEASAGTEQDTPWVLSLHLPDRPLYYEMSNASLQLIRIVQQFPEFGLLLEALRRDWRRSALIHHDIKWDNLLVVKEGSKRGGRLKIVDWELAGPGDPCWDAGSVFGEYLGHWLLSIPVTGEDPPDRFMEMARYPLEKIQPAMRRFWQSYARGMGLGDIEAQAWLVRAVRYAAARLLRTAFEQSQGSAQITGNTLCYLQLSLNILQRPQQAAVYLLGIPLNAATPPLSAQP
ncbi:MAG TPA: aminoglycoside phosphotransferase family protein [Chloroflexia bacterium]|nr:aminoglycoside phosphotransferase family protein [Chloroflexia bacterium]